MGNERPLNIVEQGHGREIRPEETEKPMGLCCRFLRAVMMLDPMGTHEHFSASSVVYKAVDIYCPLSLSSPTRTAALIRAGLSEW